MHRTTIMLPRDLKLEAQQLAGRLGISLDELVREALQSRLEQAPEPDLDDDPLFRFEVFHDDGATNLAAEHDDELTSNRSKAG